MTIEARDRAAVDRSLAHLLARLDLLGERVQAAVARRRATDPNPDDPFRGLYVSDSTVDELLDGPRQPLWHPVSGEVSLEIERTVDDWQARGAELRLRSVQSRFGLDLTDADILLAALAPDLDPRFERLYGYLHDDVTRRRASVGLVLELSGLDPTSGATRARLSPSAPLVSGGLLIVDEPDRPLLTRSLRVPDRVASHLLGNDSLDPELWALIIDVPGPGGIEWPPLERAIELGMSPIYLRESPNSSAAWTSAGTLNRLNREFLTVDLALMAASGARARLLSDLVREVRLRGLALVGTGLDALISQAPDLVRALVDSGSHPLLLAGTSGWDPTWSKTMPLLLDAPPARDESRDGRSVSHEAGKQNLTFATLAFRMTPIQEAQALATSRRIALAHGRDVGPQDLQAGARAQNGSGLDRLATRLEPHATWADLVLPTDVETQLRELSGRARQRRRVYNDWRLGGRANRGRGITALLAGDSGTGKTLASEVIAGELGLDLYVIDLSTVIDKYIGETEKNLDRIFLEADRVNGVLLFDEADAIFGKRSEVRDARDRYANVEIAYLLQRMERFDGLAILTTNLRSNVDDAFTRRIDVIVDFPMPEEEHRLALWRLHLPVELPQADDLDLDFMARRFRLSGGNIRNVCVTAAFLAADAERPVQMTDLIRGTEREYRKLGRLTVEAEFGPYIALVRSETR